MVRHTDERKTEEAETRFRHTLLDVPKHHDATIFSSNRRTPKIYVNLTPVPALVPAQYDGSGGPWQWGEAREAMKFFVRPTSAEKFCQIGKITWNYKPDKHDADVYATGAGNDEKYDDHL